MKKMNEEEFAKYMRMMGDLVKSALPDKHGFTLVIYPFYKPGRMHYISSADRNDMIKAMRELCDDLEKRGDIPNVEERMN